MRKAEKYILKALSVLIITALAFVPEIQLFQGNAYADLIVRVVIVTVLVIVSEIIGNAIAEKYNPFEDLIKFLNGCLKKEVDIVTLTNNTESSSENELSYGDEIHILTNDLMNYDLHEHALSLTAERLIAGAKYYYYIPNSIKEDYKSFKIRLSEEIQKRLNGEMSDDTGKILFENVYFFFIPDENSLAYNFSLTLFKDPRKNTGCWYINERDITTNSSQTDVPELLMVRMKSFDDVKALKKIFVKLVKRYKLKLSDSSRLFT